MNVQCIVLRFWKCTLVQVWGTMGFGKRQMNHLPVHSPSAHWADLPRLVNLAASWKGAGAQVKAAAGESADDPGRACRSRTSGWPRRTSGRLWGLPRLERGLLCGLNSAEQPAPGALGEAGQSRHPSYCLASREAGAPPLLLPTCSLEGFAWLCLWA